MKFLTCFFCALFLVGNAYAQSAPVQIKLPPKFKKIPLKTVELVEGKVGTPHEARGQVVQAINCPASLEGATVYLGVWYLLPLGDSWAIPLRTFTDENYRAGYDKLIVGGNKQLVQGRSITSAKIDGKGNFAFAWKELIKADRNPYIKARRIVESNFDPNDPLGYKEITVKRVYRAVGALKLNDPNLVSDWIIEFEPVVLLEFFGSETQKLFPPLVAKCFPVIG